LAFSYKRLSFPILGRRSGQKIEFPNNYNIIRGNGRMGRIICKGLTGKSIIVERMRQKIGRRDA
jgi:hypothetical protein